jgi:hypothetical protein
VQLGGMGDQSGAFMKKGDDDDERAWHQGHAGPLLPTPARRTGRRVVSHRWTDRLLPVWRRAFRPRRSRVDGHVWPGGCGRPVPTAARGARAGSALPRVAQAPSRTTSSGGMGACQHACPPLDPQLRVCNAPGAVGSFPEEWGTPYKSLLTLTALPACSAEDVSPFWGIEKAAVLQEARCFNDSQLDARKCQQVRGSA